MFWNAGMMEILARYEDERVSTLSRVRWHTAPGEKLTPCEFDGHQKFYGVMCARSDAPASERSSTALLR